MDCTVSQVLDLKELVSQAHRGLMDPPGQQVQTSRPMVCLRDLKAHNTSKHQGLIFLLVFKAHDLTIILHRGFESVSFNQTGPYNDPPGNAFNAPSQGLQFQRHEQMFDSTSRTKFQWTTWPWKPEFFQSSNRASGHYFDEKNLQSSIWKLWQFTCSNNSRKYSGISTGKSVILKLREPFLMSSVWERFLGYSLWVGKGF